MLDLGAGTGMLSAFALKHGAAHVTALDVNQHMCSICEAALGGYERHRWSVVCGKIG